MTNFEFETARLLIRLSAFERALRNYPKSDLTPYGCGWEERRDSEASGIRVVC